MQATLTTAGNLGQFATGYTATKYIAEFRTRNRARASRILGLCAVASTITGCLVAAALFFAAPVLAARAFHAPALATPLMIAAPAVMFIIMNGFRTGALGGLEGYGALARVGVISGIAYLALGSIGALLGGVNGALAGVAASAIVQWIVLGRLLAQETARRGLSTVYDHPWRERDVTDQVRAAGVDQWSRDPAGAMAREHHPGRPAGRARADGAVCRRQHLSRGGALPAQHRQRGRDVALEQPAGDRRSRLPARLLVEPRDDDRSGCRGRRRDHSERPMAARGVRSRLR